MIPYEGVINENYFKIQQKETDLSANLEIYKNITKNPFNKKLEYFLGILTKSKYDGVGRNLDEIDISIALDISGSMNSRIEQKETFKELALKNENENENQDNNNLKAYKNRLEIAKECLFKMINTMNDKVQMALTTFDTRSRLIINLSPKQELLSVSNLINNIKTEGGTNLSVALEGAAQCLNDSTAKFKRVIIITDGWDNNPKFMEIARNLNEKNILITILSIDPNANSNLYDKLCELKGCNYYFILNETDMEKYLIRQFNYICFPILYDMKINFKSDDADLIRTIGCGSQNEKSKNTKDLNQKQENNLENGELMNVKSLFPSDIKEFKGNYYQEGGLMLLKINPKSLDKNCKININLEYTEIEGNKFEKKFEIEFTGDEMKNGVESEEIKKGIACYYYTKFYRKMPKFLNKNVRIGWNGQHEDPNKIRPEQKYFDFILRNNENYDMIKIYFDENYENDLNEYQKEYYIKNLDKWYNNVLKKMEEYKNNPSA